MLTRQATLAWELVDFSAIRTPASSRLDRGRQVQEQQKCNKIMCRVVANIQSMTFFFPKRKWPFLDTDFEEIFVCFWHSITKVNVSFE